MRRKSLGRAATRATLRYAASASHLIRAGADVYAVSRRLGHARASTTLDVYAHEFAKAQHGETLRQQLAAAFGAQI